MGDKNVLPESRWLHDIVGKQMKYFVSEHFVDNEHINIWWLGRYPVIKNVFNPM